jgi:uncharacterized repeat protein (TIGR01451 family)
MSKHIHLLRFLSLWLLSTFSITLAAQSAWERTFGTSRTDEPKALTQTIDGGFLLIGYTTEATTAKHDILLVKTDAEGRQQWTKTIGKPNIFERAYAGISNPDGTYLIAGVRYTDTLQTDAQAWIAKLSPRGDTLWTRSFLPNFCADAFYDVQRLRDGTGYILTGTACVQSGLDNILLMKTDLNGAVIFQKTFGVLNEFDFARRVIETSDGGFVVGGTRGLYGTGNQKSQIFKTDRNGLLLWEKLQGKGDPNDCYALLADTAGGVIVTGVLSDSTVGAGTFIARYSASGQELWSKKNLNFYWGQSVFANRDGGFSFISGNLAGTRLRELLKTDALGNQISSKFLPFYSPKDEIAAILRTTDSSFVMLGERTIGTNKEFHLSKVDGNGNGSSYAITGKVYNDVNNNCRFDPSLGESPLPNWLVKLENANKTLYGLSDSLGNYQIYVDSSVYRLSLQTPNAYWQPCEDSIFLSLNYNYPLHTQDFAVKTRTVCPLMEINVATPYLRRCYDNNYVVRYCNRGTATARNVVVRLTLDKFLNFNSASRPLSNRTGNVLFFNVGDVPQGVCGTFNVNVTVRCDSTFVGQTHCVEAHVFPDSICAPTVGWSGASLAVSGSCQGDSVAFLIKNVGTGTNRAPVSHIVIIDDIIPLRGQVVLPPNGTKILKFPANGQTYRLVSDQELNHPNPNSHPTAVVEGCRTTPTTPLSIGFVTQFEEDDGDPFTSIDCHQNIGSFDPNDKQAQPVGIQAQHFIDENGEIDYTIRFQNTGTDTAFTVVVRDTLTALLDIETFRTGASSHRYELEVLDGRILKFTFPNINLVDSFRNSALSQGFIKFTVRVKSGSPFGSRIENRAAIFFDFNAPVITNKTFHTLRKPQRYAQRDTSICNNKTFDNNVYLQDVRVYDTLRFAKFDSIVINVLKILPTFKKTVDTTLRRGQLLWGISAQRDTMFSVLLVAKNGCDSLVTYKLKVITATAELSPQDIKIFPNPFSDRTTIELPPQYVGDFKLKFMDLMGKALFEKLMTGNRIDLERGDVQQGVYLFQIKRKDAVIAVGKLIIL